MIKNIDGIEIDVKEVNQWWLNKSFIGITLLEQIYVRGVETIRDSTVRHEYIHVLQQKEIKCPKIVNDKITKYVKFGIYLSIYLYDFVTKGGYMNIRFEKEAYANQNDPTYIKNRPPFNWKNY